MSALTTRSVSLTPEQIQWVADIKSMSGPSQWEWKGDCTYGWSQIKNEKLGICMTYSPITKKYAIVVNQ